MENREIRRKNFRYVIDTFFDESATKAALAISKANPDTKELNPSGLYRYLTDSEHSRGIGSKLARKIEITLKKPPGWMDLPQFNVTTGGGGRPKLSEATRIGGFNSVAVRKAIKIDDAGRFDEGDTNTLPIGTIRAFTNDSSAYAFQLSGEGYHPNIRNGWFIVIEPGAELSPGEFCCIKLTDGDSMIVEYMYKRGNEHTVIALTGRNVMPVSISDDDIELISHVGGIHPPSMWIPE